MWIASPFAASFCVKAQTSKGTDDQRNQFALHASNNRAEFRPTMS